MNFVKTLLASAALAVSFGASATVQESLGGGAGSFLSLASTGGIGGGGTLSGIAGMIVGGTVYSSDQVRADIPFGTVGNFLASGPTSGQPAVLTFAPVNYISFLWGSPDVENTLTVTSTVGAAQTFNAGSFGLPTTGDQSFSRYVQFVATAGQITGLSFNNMPSRDAFEVSNFTITPVPEPETYALMLAGLGAMAMFARRRRAE